MLGDSILFLKRKLKSSWIFVVFVNFSFLEKSLFSFFSVSMFLVVHSLTLDYCILCKQARRNGSVSGTVHSNLQPQVRFDCYLMTVLHKVYKSH